MVARDVELGDLGGEGEGEGEGDRDLIWSGFLWRLLFCYGSFDLVILSSFLGLFNEILFLGVAGE